MEEALGMARAKDTKERLAAVERLHQSLESSRRSLSSGEVTALVDCCLDLLRDNNFRVSQGALQALSSAAVLAGEHLKLHFNALVPAIVERLGDGKQPVRDAARQLLITLMEVSSPTIIVERAGNYAWTHKSWRVREEFTRTVATAIGLFASTELTLQRVLLSPVLQLFNDPNLSVREAAASCIEETYSQVGPQFLEELQRHHLSSSLMKDINARLERVEAKVRKSDVTGNHFVCIETKSAPANQRKGSPRTKITRREMSLLGGEADITEKPVEPIKLYSEKELIREIEKIASNLVPDKDWSLRISSMQRIEGLVYGGAVEYPSFHMLLKQLVPSLTAQLLDRRSSIVKQACNLLNFLSKELSGDFEVCAEMFIPVLFKLVVITVLVIAESADNCIKTMLRNCKVARVLPRISDSAKSDRNAVLRARCCEYAVLILEYWADTPEIQRSADLYEDLIKCCVADAMSEVRSTARACYRIFSKTWPERSRRLFQSFDPVIQRLLNDEDGGMHKRYASPSLLERGFQLSRSSSHAGTANLPGYHTSAIVAMDRSSSLASRESLSAGSHALSQLRPLEKYSERSLESVLNSSKQKVSAIESLLRGVNISGKQRNSSAHSTSLDLGVDPPSTCSPPVPATVPASSHLSSRNSLPTDSTIAKMSRSGARIAGSSLSNVINSQNQAVDDHSKYGSLPSDSLSELSLPNIIRKYSEKAQVGFNSEHNIDSRFKKLSNMQLDRHYQDASCSDADFRDPYNTYVPNFQRPLLRKQATGRSLVSGRNSFDDGQLQVGQLSNYMDGPRSLGDALADGLSSTSDWVARVSAFNFLQNLLEQGPKGIQEVTQSFEKVMKLFFRHLDDPHHKVAQAALSTLSAIIPTCRKPFESYLERILPHVFSRLIDPKEPVRQPCRTTLEIVGRTYGIDSLLPALVRSLDEQRPPKAKLAVIEFANISFNKHSPNPEGCLNSGFLKLWLSKLAPFVSDKNTKLKEASTCGIISVYCHFDTAVVLNFILSLSIEEQNILRRSLKQYTPRIEVDLVNSLQSKKERQRPKSFYDQTDVGNSSDDGYNVVSKKSQYLGRQSGGSTEDDGGRKWSSMQESIVVDASITQGASDEALRPYINLEPGSDNEIVDRHCRELRCSMDSVSETNMFMKSSAVIPNTYIDNENNITIPQLDISSIASSDGSKVIQSGGQSIDGLEIIYEKFNSARNNIQVGTEIKILQILHDISSSSDDNSSLSKCEALQNLVEASVINDSSVWTKHFNQILTAVLELVDDPDSSIRELSLSLIAEMLTNQKKVMEDSVEVVIEKLLHVSKDAVSKISNEVQRCLTILLTLYDPFRCLPVIVPMLVSEDEKTLVTCINCLTKLVGRLSYEKLMSQLPSFLPALFDAFGNQSPDVRKSVVFCLVDIYIILGKAFLPYLEGLSSTQLRLVTIYANRISQARSVAPADANQP